MHAAYIEKPDIFSGSAAKLIFNCMFVPTNRRKRRTDAQLLSLQPESVCSNLRFLQVSSHLSEEKTMKSTGKQRTKTQVAVTHLKKKRRKAQQATTESIEDAFGRECTVQTNRSAQNAAH